MLSRLLGLALLALALPLASCGALKTISADISAVEGTTVSAKAIVIAVNAANAVIGTATNYKNSPLCTSGQTFLKNGCSSQAVITAITPAVNSLIAAKQALLAAGLSATTNQLSLLNAAKATLLAALTSEGIS